MLKDLPENIVHGIFVAAVLENSSPSGDEWAVYVINERKHTISNVLVRSQGYGVVNDESVRTSTFRFMIPELESANYRKIEPIDPELFGLNNEYWISFFDNGVMYDKKFIFLPESIIDNNMISVPIINKPGVVIGS